MEASPPHVHVPILTEALVELLALTPGARCIDATIDGGGHTAAILERSAPDGSVLGIDRDPEVLVAVERRLAAAVESGRLHLANADFRALSRVAAARHFAPVQGVVFDLGVSSFHFDVSGRGFSFMRPEPLDMRFDPTGAGQDTAANLLASWTADELAAIFRSYGEERYARRIAARIVAQRQYTPLRSTDQLFDLVAAALPGRIRWQAARSAARVFQALRIAVNDELEAISAALPQALELLVPGGRLAVLAFHSLEDRIVKHFFVAERQAGRVRILTKKPLRPGAEEIAANPRAAAAKLRVCERLAPA
jgi:16S rRNA (cytosine1402-N4)-methyltransferase